MPLMGINRHNSAKCALSTTENRTTITISLVYLLRNFSIGFESLTEWFSLNMFVASVVILIFVACSEYVYCLFVSVSKIRQFSI